MKNEFLGLVKNSQTFLIGMVHLAPLSGYENSPGLETIVDLALKDARVLIEAGFDAILVENNYDVPHTEFIHKEAGEQIIAAVREIKKNTNLPVGLCVLWNDYKTALDVAVECKLDFVRIPVFVDKIETNYGFVIEPNYKAIKKYQLDKGASEVCLFTDVQVKHSTLLNPRPLSESVKEAESEGSDGIIVTGKWTGDQPIIADLEVARQNSSLPIIVGSGTDKENIGELKNFADAFIVGSTLKGGATMDKEIEPNLHPWQNRLDLEKAREFVLIAKKKTVAE